MANTFTYVNDLSTALYYARKRLDDIAGDSFVDVDGVTPSPALWDEEYEALFDRFGVQEGMAQAASIIALRITKTIESFGEAAGVRFTLRDASYYEKLADLIRSEPPFDAATAGYRLGIRVGRIKAGVDDTLEFRQVTGWPIPTV